MSVGVDEYERAPCPWCGAHTEAEAAPLCKPVQTQSGDYHCGQPEEDVDEAGYFVRPTPAALERLDAWVTAEAIREGWISPDPEPTDLAQGEGQRPPRTGLAPADQPSKDQP